jgi:hypothetical protein
MTAASGREVMHTQHKRKSVQLAGRQDSPVEIYLAMKEFILVLSAFSECAICGASERSWGRIYTV